MRKTFKVKRGIVGSSDYSRVKSNRADLELNHKKFVNSPLYTALVAVTKPSREPSPETIVKVAINGKWITMEYSVVKAAGYKNWELL